MRFQAVTQLILVGLSLVIIFTVVRPMFAEIRSNQDEVQKFKQAVNTAGQFNARLTELRNRANDFSPAELSALELYVPAKVDVLSVSRDIVAIAERNDLIVQSVEVDDAEEGVSEEPVTDVPLTPSLDPEDPDFQVANQGELNQEVSQSLRTRQFTLQAIGTYDQMKRMLADFERNVYPLRLVEFDFSVGVESQFFVYTVVLETYALNFE